MLKLTRNVPKKIPVRKTARNIPDTLLNFSETSLKSHMKPETLINASETPCICNEPHLTLVP